MVRLQEKEVALLELSESALLMSLVPSSELQLLQNLPLSGCRPSPGSGLVVQVIISETLGILLE